MCQIYAKADSILYESRTRSLRIRGVLTTIRLENLFWDVLSEMASRERMSTNGLIVQLHDELLAVREEPANFASFLRVCCLRYWTLRAGNERTTEEAPSEPVLRAGRDSALRAVM